MEKRLFPPLKCVWNVKILKLNRDPAQDCVGCFTFPLCSCQELLLTFVAIVQLPLLCVCWIWWLPYSPVTSTAINDRTYNISTAIMKIFAETQSSPAYWGEFISGASCSLATSKWLPALLRTSVIQNPPYYPGAIIFLNIQLTQRYDCLEIHLTQRVKLGEKLESD